MQLRGHLRQWCLSPRPIWGDDGETVQGVAEGLADEFQPVQHPKGRDDMGGIGALASTCLEEAALTHPGQQRFKQELFRLPRDPPGPELPQHGVVEARVGQLEA
jgi:hypothetical protein